MVLRWSMRRAVNDSSNQASVCAVDVKVVLFASIHVLPIQYPCRLPNAEMSGTRFSILEIGERAGWLSNMVVIRAANNCEACLALSFVGYGRRYALLT